MTTRPEHSTCPKWAARLAREQALEEAAEVATTMVENRDRVNDKRGATIASIIAGHIRALKTKEPA